VVLALTIALIRFMLEVRRAEVAAATASGKSEPLVTPATPHD
jgi:hypothetical protein